MERADWLAAPDGLTPLPGGSVTSPAGFRAAGVACGLKPSGARDLGILTCDRPAAAGYVDTTNALPAAPVRRNRTLDLRRLRAVVVNSGNANAATGERGLRDAAEMGERAAAGLGLDPSLVAPCSTGVIGRLFEMDRVRAGVDGALAALARAGGGAFAEAIRTTDRLEKAGAFRLEIGGREVTIGVAAKGAGMISPRMATMLCHVTTDVAVAADDLQAATQRAADASFNRISVDGQMSPSDTLLVLAGGSGVPLAGGDLERFTAALTAVCRWCAILMVKDGEGADHAVRLLVRGAADDREAERVARHVGDSPLVKAALFGRDPNWGRIEQAVGQALVGVPGEVPEPVLAFDGLSADHPGAGAVLARAEYDIALDLGRGTGRAERFACDLTHAYVSLNADYTT